MFPKSPLKGKTFIAVILSLCAGLLFSIGYIFYSSSQSEDLQTQPYVAIVNNNLGAKAKILLLKSAVLNYLNSPSKKKLTTLKLKSRAYKSSILQDLSSEKTILIHKTYGNYKELTSIIDQITQLAEKIQSFDQERENLELTRNIIEDIDSTYVYINEYLSGFIASVQRDQINQLNSREEYYKKQYLYYSFILITSLAIIIIVSYLYMSQIKLFDNLKLQSLQMRKAQKKAEASAEAKAKFLANMSHEIRTPGQPHEWV